MRFINKTTYKMIIIESFVFIMEFLGIFYIFTNLNGILKEYDNLLNDYIYSENVMQDIKVMIQQDQILTANYVMEEEAGAMFIYEQQKDLNREMLQRTLSEFGKIMAEKDQKVIFHQLLSSCRTVFEKSDKAIKIRKNGGRKNAVRFFISVQDDFNGQLNACVEKLSNYIEDQVLLTTEKIQAHKKVLNKVILFIILVVMFSLALAVYFVVRLSVSLENRKNNLEKEVEEKTEQVVNQNNRLISMQRDTIYGMANLIESRNGETGEHVKRTSLYVELIAKNLRKRGLYKDILTDHYIELLEKAAPMHDVGKIVVPDNILTKPGKFTEDEFEVMKKHAEEGGRIVREVLGQIEDDDYVEMASNVAAYHHERWNGSGYPNHLCGEAIPLCARIMAIADVFDALVSPRCYKSPMSPEEAFEIIRDSSGSHFDPIIAELFLEKKEEVLKILKETD